MLGSKLGPVAAAVLLAGVAGCSLPEVLPLAGGTTAGPSPYGSWYEQHWATNAVLLAAADEPNGDSIPTDEEMKALETEQSVDEMTLPETKVEVNSASSPEPVDFDNSTPFQFPSSEFNPAPARPAAPSYPDVTPPSPKTPAGEPALGSEGAIRY